MRQGNGGAKRVAQKLDPRIKAIRRLADREDADLFLYSAPIMATAVDRLRNTICRKRNKRPNALLFLTTFGGDPDAAFRLASCLHSHYDNKFAAYVFGLCKSAGTLVVTGADRIVYGDFGELGPLDVQLTKPDEIYPTSSGLDIFQAMGVLTNSAYEAFQAYLISIIAQSEGHISAKTSAEIARELAVGLFAPMTAQIEPERLGEVQRAINIAREYGLRLDRQNLKKEALEKLVQGYPTHSFVIHFDEAKKLFVKVRRCDTLEAEVASYLPGIRRPATEPLTIDVVETYNATPKGVRYATKAKTKRTRRGVRASARQTAGNVAQLRPDASGDVAPSKKDPNPRGRPKPKDETTGSAG
jgi:hypothetical protein